LSSERKTQAPLIYLKLGNKKLASSFVQFDPVMMKNGLYLSPPVFVSPSMLFDHFQPLRDSPQAYYNVATVRGPVNQVQTHEEAVLSDKNRVISLSLK
jgi:hypothetical protein